MSEQSTAAVSAGADPEWAAGERQLHLLDQLIGLRAQLAEQTVRHQVSLAGVTTELEKTLELLHQARTADAVLRSELELALQQLADLRASRTWRIGRLATQPLAAANRVLRGRRSR